MMEKEGRGGEATASLAEVGAEMHGSNVVVVAQFGDDSNMARAEAAIVAQCSGTIVRTGKTHAKVLIPIRALDELAGLQDVTFVRLPIKKRKHVVVSEGKAKVGANSWNSAGFTGQGVKLAVVDSDFLGLNARIASGEIPASATAVDFSGTGMASGSDGHGCACAEIIYDIAPGVDLYLLKAVDLGDDEAAKDYCKAQGIQIVSSSGGYDALSFHDGVAYSSITPHPVSVAEDAQQNGILWVNSAGNEQRQHALITWRDGDANAYLDWSSSAGAAPMNELWNEGNPIDAGTELNVLLTWNDWPTSDQDFDLELYKLVGSTWTYVTTSDDYQTGTQPPRERLTYTVTSSARYAVSIYKARATTSPSFIVRSYPHELFYFGYDNISSPAPGSITIPGDAAACFTVGAIDYGTYTNGPVETYSSLGPNNGAYTMNPTVVKPDACGPDFVSTETYGADSFPGTSASAPHIAALAALVKEANPSYTPAQIRSYIEANGVDLGTVGKDNTYGSGAVVLPTPSPTRPTLQASPLQTEDGIEIRWNSFTNHHYTIHVSTNLLTGFSVLQSNIIATPPSNIHTGSVAGAQRLFWKVSVEE